MAEREYQRLTWSRRRPGIAVFTIARASLWLGKDHLLYIETNGYTENYKRFYFRDIQAITVYRTNARLVASIVLGIVASLVLLIGLATHDRTAMAVTFTILPWVLIPLVINFALGPTCKCQLRTAVQTEDLPIHRVGRARKILERLRPLIAAAQGQLTGEEVTARMQQLAAGTGGASARGPVAAAQGQSTAIQGNEVRSGENRSNFNDRAGSETGALGQDALPGAVESHGSRSNRDATTDSDAPPSAVS